MFGKLSTEQVHNNCVRYAIDDGAVFFCTDRHLLYKILDVLVAKIVPEVNQPQFTSQLLLHRTRVLNL